MSYFVFYYSIVCYLYVRCSGCNRFVGEGIAIFTAIVCL